MANRSVAIIGAGFIAPAHVQAIKRRRDVSITAIVDPSEARATELIKTNAGARYYPSIDALLDDQKPFAAHVLTPPPLHAATSVPLLKTGVHVLLEKPMAETPEQCSEIRKAANDGDVFVGINHNFVHHPTFKKAADAVRSGRYGRLRRVQMRYAAPLRQLTARQFGHWMFDCPRNLLLEQAVHPLSQMHALLAGFQDVAATPGQTKTPAPGVEIVTDWMLNIEGEQGLGQAQIVLGSEFPSWTVSILCDDGVVDADIFEGRVSTRYSHNDIPAIDFGKRNFGAGLDGFRSAAVGMVNFIGELSRLAPPSDGFSRSMIASVDSFYAAISDGRDNSEIGQALVEQCNRISREAAVAPIPATPAPRADQHYDVAVIGGTGFVGQHLVKKLVDDGKTVAVVARNTRNLPTLFHHKNIGVFKASIADKSAITNVLKNCRQVVNLAHGGGGASRTAITGNMVNGARNVAEAAIAAKSERLIFVSSSAALYLGDSDAVVTSKTPPDENPERRADYAFAKVKAEEAMAAYSDIPIVIMRPAIVVGEGGDPFHSALGAYENPTHCDGWNAGQNPLPFVLVEDVASAIARALEKPTGDIAGHAFNLVGDVQWHAKQYIDELGAALERPLRHHGNSVYMLFGAEWAKYIVKRVAGRQGVATPSLRDFRSRGMVATIDTSDEKNVLDWRPCADENDFRRRAIYVHRRTSL